MSDATNRETDEAMAAAVEPLSPTTASTTDDDVLLEMADEAAARLRRGEPVRAADYVARRPDLEGRIRGVLAAICAMEDAGTVDAAAPAADPVGTTVGRYRLLERIGEGGFGVVYMAEQHHPVRRRVALKLVKPGMDSRQVLARFEAERQALAIMDHPNIAKVFDGGLTDTGRPYFVMELVKGEPITDFCDRNQLPPRQRLELFVEVCQAVQHAHQKGVIHRDIKPSNVLVAVHDTTPVVKVIDFGIAKALGHELTERTLFTGFAQLVGTPLYMSPEQAGQSAIDVDTRSDVYSLGVLLYELLTGSTPFDGERFRRAAEDEIRRIIREEEPPRPSTRLSASKDRLPSISAQRRTEPVKLTRLVRGELDWIVMKALEKDRARRYGTASGFAADVQRYLADEPVLACPPSAAYRLRKFARRHKVALMTASVVGVALLLAVGSLGWTARDRTARRAKVAGQVESILGEVEQLEREQKWPEALAAARRAEAVLAGGGADGATAGRVRDRLRDHEFIDALERARMSAAMTAGRTFDHAAAERAYADAFQGYGVDVDGLAVEESVRRLKARPGLAIPISAALDEWGSWRRFGKADAAAWARLIAVARGIDADPVRDRLRATMGRPGAEVADELLRLAGSIDVRTQHPITITRLARLLQMANQPDAAVRVLRDAQALHPDDFWLNYTLGQVLHQRKDFEGAVRFYTAAVAIRPRAVQGLNQLGRSLQDLERPDEAIAVYRRAIEIDPTFASAYNHLGVTLRRQKRLDEADAAFHKSIEIDPGAPAPHVNLGLLLTLDRQDHVKAVECYRKAIELDPTFTIAHLNLALALERLGKANEAVAACRTGIELEPGYAHAHFILGTLLFDQKRPDEAIAPLREAAKLDPKNSVHCYALGKTLLERGKPTEASDWFRRAIELDPENAADSHAYLGRVLLTQGKLDEATATLRRAIQLSPKNAVAHDDLGHALARWGRLEESIVARERAIELDPKVAGFHHNLALSLVALKRYDEAITQFREAIALDSSPVSRSHLASTLNKRAWELANPEPPKRDPARAVQLAKEALRLNATASTWNTLGMAQYRAGRWAEAVDSLLKYRESRTDDAEGSNPFLLAMAYWQLGKADEARRWYETAVQGMDKKSPASDALIRFRVEAAALTGVDAKTGREPNNVSATTRPRPTGP